MNIIANVVGSVEKYLANNSVQADDMDDMFAYEHKYRNNNVVVNYNNKTSLWFYSTLQVIEIGSMRKRNFVFCTLVFSMSSRILYIRLHGSST